MAGRAYDPPVPVHLAGVQVGGDGARAARRGHVEAESRDLFNTGLLDDDGIIDPRDTRTVLGIALSACHSGEVKGTDGFGVFRM
jgi:acetyl-CoA carboxylase carboxyltransferase component